MISARRVMFLFFIYAFLSTCVFAQADAEIQSPESVFAFIPGSDRQLIDYGQLVDYLRDLAVASDRVALREVGTSPLGRKMYVAFISAPENLARLDELRGINERLALDPEIPEEERADLVREGRVFVLATLSMHSGEVGPRTRIETTD